MTSSIASKFDLKKHRDETIVVLFDFTPHLKAGRLIGSVDDVAIDTNPGDALTAASLGITASPATLAGDPDGVTIDTGKAVRVQLAGGTAGRVYGLKVTITDDNATAEERDTWILTAPLHIF